MVPGTTLQVVPVDNDVLSNKNGVVCIVQDQTVVDWKSSKFHVNLPLTTTVQDLYVHTGKEWSYEENSFLLVWQRTDGGQNREEFQEVDLKDDLKNMTLEDVGLAPEKKKQRFFLRQKDGIHPVSTKSSVQEKTPCENADDVLADGSVSNLFDSSSSGATAAATASTSYPYYGPYNSNSTANSYSSDGIAKSTTGFVGLVNQAMTCYLNSLLQTLFMTPEFRNAIYKWRFVGNEEAAEKSIPYQLQRLFVCLQFSSKRAVETTDVTKSFGWDSSDAWQQHDVQELCRVMFDALETVFKDTDQANLINHLYQGKLKDYVKCLECEYESARSDTYLDIPLVIRPFGVDNNPHGSVEEALDAFVKPETLEGNNQYKCDQCKKLCDAHKGLKFCSFPYLLTLQLKRFAFDYNLLHRVKLNDRMTFPKHLNLNKYVTPDDEEKSDSDSLSQKSDSPSSVETDSGVSLTSSENSAGIVDDLGEVLMEVGERAEACTALCVEQEENENLQGLKGPEGPYMYELFSIMIHSGSAIGGHYYAYIKSFEDNQWYSFNDQTVTTITNSDIKRTFGGADSSSRGYYSSHYSSSANAYMLMYRQIRRDKCLFMAENELPDHVKKLVSQLHEDEIREQEMKDFQRNVCRIKIFCWHPVRRYLMDNTLEIHKDKTLKEATILARKLFHLEKVVSPENCRIVKYDEYNENLELSYEDKEDANMFTILGGVQQSYMFDLMLETKSDDEEFPVYAPGGITVKVHQVNMREQTVRSAFSVRVLWTDNLNKLQDLIRQKLNTSDKYITMVWERYLGEFFEIKPSESKTLRDENFFKKNKIFVVCADDEPDVSPNGKFLEILDHYSNSIRLQVSLPDDLYTTGDNVFNMVIHKRSSLSEFKEKLETRMGCPSEMFKVFRVYSNNQEMEMDRLTDTFSSVPDGSKILIKHGRALKQDEFRAKVFLLCINESQHMQVLLESVISKAMTVLESKKNFHQELLQSCNRNIPVERMRLRKKSWKSPGKIFRNDQKYDEVLVCAGTAEMFLQELEGPDPVKSEEDLSLFIRRWCPSKYTFDDIEEVVLAKSVTVSEFKDKISSRSGILADDIEIAKGRGSFPYEVSVLDAQDELEWNPKGETLLQYPIMIHEDGALFYYRDKNEPLMELSEEKRNEIKKAENAKSTLSSSRNVYKPKEKALKIYTDR